MNILYATDGSGSARTAGRLLASLPLPADSQVTVLTAVHHDQWLESLTFTDTAVQEDRHAREMAQHDAEEGAALLRRRGWRVAPSIGGEDAAVAILRQAQADRADLIVLGSHNRHGFERVVVGSVSEHVARYARTSVLVARNDAVHRVLVAVDGSESSGHAIDALARLPLPAESRVTLVYVAPEHAREWPAVWTPEWVGETPSPTSEAEARHAAEKVFDRATRRLRVTGRSADVQICHGHPAEQILAAARQADADLVVVGSANRSVLGRLVVGSVSARVLGRATCSVLVARPAVPTAYVPSRATEVVNATV
jgi:nucleotide-binding universal stress UspA family protein